MSRSNNKITELKKYKKLIIVIFSIILFLILLFFGTNFLINELNKNSAINLQNNSNDSTPISLTEADLVNQDATRAVYGADGTVDKGVAIYDKAINDFNSSDKTLLGQLYYDKATLLFNNSKYDEALAAALKAIETIPRADTYGLIGDIYFRKGDKSNASIAYNNAISYLPTLADKSDTNDSDGGTGQGAMRSYYEGQIEILKDSL